ncbi:MAG: response regulator [Methanobacteriota archaeon]
MTDEKIMIIEEDLYTASQLADTLALNGYTVVDIVSSGESAISIVDHVSLDLILMDIMLKGPLDGLMTATEILSRTVLPIIYLTPLVDEELVIRSKNILPYGFLTKPVDEEKLIVTIKRALTWHAWCQSSGEPENQKEAGNQEGVYSVIQEDRLSSIKNNKLRFPVIQPEWMAY